MLSCFNAFKTDLVPEFRSLTAEVRALKLQVEAQAGELGLLRADNQNLRELLGGAVPTSSPSSGAPGGPMAVVLVFCSIVKLQQKSRLL